MTEEQLQDEVDRLNDLLADSNVEIKDLEETISDLKTQVSDRDYDMLEIYNISKKY